jgi:hypothetical protein
VTPNCSAIRPVQACCRVPLQGVNLNAAARQTVFDEPFIMRVLQAALDRDAYSTIARAVAAATSGG